MDTPPAILGVRNISAARKHFLEEDFSDFGKLHRFLGEVSVYQCDITEQGVEYLRKLGLERIAIELQKLGGFPDFDYLSAPTIYGFLISLEPNAARKTVAAYARIPDPAASGEKAREPCKSCGHEFEPHVIVANNRQKAVWVYDNDQKLQYRRGFMFCPVENCDCMMAWDFNPNHIQRGPH